MRVLVVEDEPLIRLGVASLMEEAGFAVAEAANADEALRVIETAPDIAILITDVDMPGSMDGLALTRVVSDRWPRVGLVVISGKVGVNPSALPPGARYFPKPYRDETLLSAVRTLGSAGAE